MSEAIRSVRVPKTLPSVGKKAREGEEQILGRVKGLELPAALQKARGLADRNGLAFNYCIGGLRALYMISTSSNVPIGMRLEAAMKLADAGMVLCRGDRRPAKAKTDPAGLPGVDAGDDLDEVPPEELELPGGGTAPATSVEPAEEIPSGWGEEPASESPEPEGQGSAGGERTESPPAPSEKKRLGRPRELLSNRILRQVSNHGPLTKAQLKQRLQWRRMPLSKEFGEVLEMLCDKGHLERLQRAKTGIVYYGTPDQIRLAREHGPG